MRKAVCKLSEGEAAALRIYGVLPVCTSGRHTHVTRQEALTLMTRDMVVTIGEEYGLNAIVEHASNNYVWRSKASAGIKVRQMCRRVR